MSKTREIHAAKRVYQGLIAYAGSDAFISAHVTAKRATLLGVLARGRVVCAVRRKGHEMILCMHNIFASWCNFARIDEPGWLDGRK